MRGFRRYGRGAVGALALASALAYAPFLLAQTETAPADPALTAPVEDALRPAIDPETPALPVTDPAATAAAGETVVNTTAEQEALAAVEASISLTAERTAALKAEIEAMKGDRDRQNAALIAAAQRVKLAEIEVTAMEERLGELIVAELEVRGRLDGADSSISNVLAALERISRNPPPALIVDPSDALGSARGAILISAIIPQLRAKADALIADLNQLTEIKAAALKEEELLKANFAILEEEQLRIATLVVARKANENRASTALAAEEAEAAALAEKAGSLKQLIDDLQKRAVAVAAAADATATANSGGAVPALPSETVRLALSNPERTEPAVPFQQARGFLTFPSGGVSVIEYGGNDGFGGISRGVSVVTRPEAQVVSPADGWVLYRGDYLNYGQIVILNAGQDYTILLAGLAQVGVEVGQFVRMGEPVGTMGSRTIGRTVTTNAGVANPTLYIEMRKNSEPLDPTGWWAPPETPT